MTVKSLLSIPLDSFGETNRNVGSHHHQEEREHARKREQHICQGMGDLSSGSCKKFIVIIA